MISVSYFYYDCYESLRAQRNAGKTQLTRRETIVPGFPQEIIKSVSALFIETLS